MLGRTAVRGSLLGQGSPAADSLCGLHPQVMELVQENEAQLAAKQEELSAVQAEVRCVLRGSAAAAGARRRTQAVHMPAALLVFAAPGLMRT